MNDAKESHSFSELPYEPPLGTSLSLPMRLTALFVLPAVIVSLLNCGLSSREASSEVLEFAKWGAFVGEFIVLACWFSWGVGLIEQRFAISSVIGLLWMASAWLGFAMADPGRLWTYRAELLQTVTVVPLMFGISSLPLFLFRKRFRFVLAKDSGASQFVPRLPFRPYQVAFLWCVLTGVAITAGYAFDREPLGSMVTATVCGIVLGIMSLAILPVTAWATLSSKLSPWLLGLSLLVVPVVGAGLSLFFPVMGPGASGEVFAVTESMIAAAIALAPSIGMFFFWRSLGLRVQSRAQKLSQSGSD